MDESSDRGASYSTTITEGALRRLTLSVLWFNMVTAPGFFFWPVLAALTVVAIVFVFLASGWFIVLYLVIAAVGAYSVVIQPVRLYRQLLGRLSRDTPVGEYRTVFLQDQVDVFGPKTPRRIRFDDVAWIEHRRGCVVLALGEDARRRMAYADALFPSNRVEQIRAWGAQKAAGDRHGND